MSCLAVSILGIKLFLRLSVVAEDPVYACVRPGSVFIEVRKGLRSRAVSMLVFIHSVSRFFCHLRCRGVRGSQSTELGRVPCELFLRIELWHQQITRKCKRVFVNVTWNNHKKVECGDGSQSSSRPDFLRRPGIRSSSQPFRLSRPRIPWFSWYCSPSSTIPWFSWYCSTSSTDWY